MAKITITTVDGEVIGQIDTGGYNLEKSFARVQLHNEIHELIDRADEKDGWVSPVVDEDPAARIEVLKQKLRADGVDLEVLDG